MWDARPPNYNLSTGGAGYEGLNRVNTEHVIYQWNGQVRLSAPQYTNAHPTLIIQSIEVWIHPERITIPWNRFNGLAHS